MQTNKTQIVTIYINFQDHTVRSWISTNVNNEQCEIEKTNPKFIFKQAFDS